MPSSSLLCVFVSSLLLAASSACAYAPFFVENAGQWEGDFAFKAQVGNATYFVTPTGMTIDLREYDRPSQRQTSLDRFGLERESQPVSVRGHVLKLNFVNANPSPEILGQDKLPSYSNYFIGRDSCKWHSRVPHYQRVTMKEVWPGIDVELVAQKEGVETVYHVSPFADPSLVEIEVEGLSSPLSVDANGRVLLPTSLGTLEEQAPYAYQQDGRIQKSVSAHYQMISSSHYALTLYGYDPQKAVVIDPVLYGTLLGGDGPDDTSDMFVQADGTVFVGGNTNGDSGFPTTPGAYQEFTPTGGYTFVTAFAADGDSLRFSTYFGPDIYDPWGGGNFSAIAVDSSGTIYLGGSTNSAHWPLTPDALDTVVDGNRDCFMNFLSADGASLLYGTLLGGIYADGVCDMAVQGDSLYSSGKATPGFPVTPNALYPNFTAPNGGAGFLTVMNTQTRNLAYSTLIPATGGVTALAMQLVPPGEVWLGGETTALDFPVTPGAFQTHIGGDTTHWDGFFSLFNLNQNTLVYSSYLGGSSMDYVYGLSAESDSVIALTGNTWGVDFPVSPEAYDTSVGSAFLTVVHTNNGTFSSTRLGGTWGEEGHTCAMIGDQVVVTGFTYSYDFPTTSGAFDTVFNDDGLPSDYYGDMFVSRFNADLTELNYSTFIGGWHTEFGWHLGGWIENQDTVWLGGVSASPDFPLTPNAVQTEQAGNGDAFICRFSIGDTGLTATKPVVHTPSSWVLSAYPNPFNSSATLSFNLPSRSNVSMTVFDILGRRVMTTDWGVLNAGDYQRPVDFSSLASGTYFARLQAPQQIMIKRLVLLR